MSRATVDADGVHPLETHEVGDTPEDEELEERLRDAGIDFFRVRKKAVLSKYFNRRDSTFPLLVYEPEVGRVSRIEDYTPLYRRFDDEVGLSRFFCKPDQLKRARLLVRI